MKRGLEPRRLARRVWRGIEEDELEYRAAGLSFYFLFSLFPALLFLTALVGLLSEPGLMEQVLGYAEKTMPEQAAWLLRRTLAEIAGGAREGFLSLGIILSLWAASSGMVSVIGALNRIFRVAEPRPWWKRRLVAIGLTVGFSLLLLLALLLLGFGAAAGHALAEKAGLGARFSAAWEAARRVLGLLAALWSVSLVYRLAPALERPRRWLTPGSAFAVASWLAMSYGLRLYLGLSDRYNAVYGSIGGVVLLLLWLYLGALALLVGAEIDAQIDRGG